MTQPTFVPVADSGLLVEFAASISDETSDAVLALDRVLTSADIHGICEVVPAFVNLLVVFDPLILDHEMAQAEVEKLLALTQTEAVVAPAKHDVLVCYDATFGQDLAAVAAACEMSVEAVIATHLTGDYRVCMYGFAPGYAYMSGVAPSIQVPRKTAVVRGVAAGSVIIAGPQNLITTLEMPTGWSILGRSPTRILQDDPDLPVLFALGDRVQLKRIDLATFERLEAAK